MSAGRARELLWVALAAALAHLVSLAVPWFQWDDPLYVTANLKVQASGWAGLVQLWSSADAYSGRFLEFFPLRDSVYWALWQLVGKDPLPFHAVNIAFHTVASGLVLALGRRLGLERAAFWGAMLFAVHPIHVESVAWVAGLKDPLATSLLLGATLLYLRYRETLRPLDYALALLLLVAALLVKSVAIAFPVALVALERLGPSPSSWKVTVQRVAGPAIIAALFTVQFVLIGRASGVITPPHGGSWSAHVALMTWAFVRYLQQAFAPVALRLHYCFEPPAWPFDVRMLGALAAIVALVVFFRWASKKEPTFALLGAWFFIWLLPVANIIPFPSLMADRYLYAPTVGTCLLAAAVLARLPAGRWMVIVLLAGYAAMAVARGLAWRHERTLWTELAQDKACETDDLITSPVIYLQNAGLAGTPAEALALWKKALEHPGFPRLRVEDQCPELSKGARVAAGAGDVDASERWSARAVALCPHQSHAWTSRLWATRNRNLPLALDAAHRAFRLDPNADTQWDYGLARLAAGDAVGADDLAAAAAANPVEYCPSLLDWAGKAAPENEARIATQKQRCLVAPGP